MLDNDLPLCMQPGWDPTTPGKEMQRRLLDAAAKAREEGDLDEADRLIELAKE